MTVNTDKFTVAAASGNTTVGGTLDVTGLTTLSATNGLRFGTETGTPVATAITSSYTDITNANTGYLATASAVYDFIDHADGNGLSATNGVISADLAWKNE